ncbi:MAG: class I SAM-dependent methyltransferase [Planctomycetota bacterium]
MVEPGEVAVWRAACRDDAFLRAAADCDPGDAASLSRLRALVGRPDRAAEITRAAISIVGARTKGQAKFGDVAATLLADAEGVEQATSRRAARPKAIRFARLIDAGYAGPVLDLGCGIGADAWALKEVGVLGVVAVDIDPVRAAMAAENAGVPSVVADLNTIATGGVLDVRGRLIHLDPARRTRAEGETRQRRTFALDELEPSPATLRRLIERSAGAAVKLSPGMYVHDVNEALGEGEACFYSEPAGRGEGAARKLTQAVWFTGALTDRPAVDVAVPRRAVLVRADDGWDEFDGEPVDARDLKVSPLGRLLVVPDPAAERAQLLHRLGLATLHPGLGLLTGDAWPVEIPGAWGRAYEVVADMPWRPAKVRRWLVEHDATLDAVKTRGRACEPDAVLRELRGCAKKNAAPGGAALTLFVLRLGKSVVAILTRPLPTKLADAEAAPPHPTP